MKDYISIVVLIFLFSWPIHAQAPIFTDDFNAETTSSFPSKWTQVSSGNETKVVNSPVYEGGKALKMQGAFSWSSTIKKDLIINQDFYIDFWVNIPDSSLTDEHKGLVYYDGFGIGFKHVGSLTEVRVESGETDTLMMPCGGWHHIRVEVDWDSDIQKTYVDGILGPTVQKTKDGTLYLQLSSGNMGTSGAHRTIYFDKIEIGTLIDGLVAYYPFTNGSVADSSGNGNDGIVNGDSPANDRFGNPDAAYSFNGVSDSIDCGNRLSLQIIGDITVSVWSKFDNSQNADIVGKYSGYSDYQDAGWDISTNKINPKKMNFGGRDHSGTYWKVTSTDTIDGGWHFIVGQRMGNLWRLFIDGILNQQVTATSAGDISNQNNLIIGHQGRSTYFFKGLIDDIRIYNRALSDSEINLLYGNYRQRITAVSDIPNDQGGKVRIRWNKIYLDSIGDSPQITSYGVWRKIPAGGMVTKRAPSTLSIMNDTLGTLYDYLGTVNSVQSPSYNFIAQTLDDSSSTGSHAETYLITAHTSDPNVYYISDAAIGYSVDNLAPASVQTLTASLNPDLSVQLNWDKNTVDHDFKAYEIHRSTQLAFSLDTIIISAENSFKDNSVVPGYHYYYLVLSMDVHGNRGLPSPIADIGEMTTQSYSFSPGWKMVSVFLEVPDKRKSALFPGIQGSAFLYDHGYQVADTLTNGIGYWIKPIETTPVPITGYLLNSITINVSQGWNMVGSVSSPVAAASLTSDPPGLITSSFYGYSGGYFPKDTIYPGEACWVKFNGNGKLTMSSSFVLISKNRITIIPTSELPPPPPSASGEKIWYNTPGAYSLAQNYPNPFNPTTTISYALPQSAHVTLGVYNTLGERVALLVDGQEQAGYHDVNFKGEGLASGVYFYRIQAGGFMDVKKLVLMK